MAGATRPSTSTLVQSGPIAASQATCGNSPDGKLTVSSRGVESITPRKERTLRVIATSSRSRLRPSSLCTRRTTSSGATSGATSASAQKLAGLLHAFRIAGSMDGDALVDPLHEAGQHLAGPDLQR